VDDLYADIVGTPVILEEIIGRDLKRKSKKT
jgi:hypothetical protein